MTPFHESEKSELHAWEGILKIITLVLNLVLSSVAFASNVTVGDKVDLKCIYRGGNTAENSITLSIQEKGIVDRKNIPAEVPEVFMDDQQDDKYSLREFVVSGSIKISDHGIPLFDTTLNKSFYGGLSFPDIADGILRTNAYGSYADSENFRALTIEQSKVNEPLDISIYWTKSYSTSTNLDCTGTVPAATTARPGVVHAERYDRAFKCELAAGKTFPAATFEMEIKNLQNQRLMKVVEKPDQNGKTGWFINGKGMDEHLLGNLNQPDAQLLNLVNRSNETPKTRLVSRYHDECGSNDCFVVELDIAYPERADTQIAGSFRHYINEPKADGDSKPVLKGRAKVSCSLK